MKDSGEELDLSKRKKIPKKVEAAILVKSKRRCCVCFFLKGDDAVKKGQIAHLDGDPSNCAEENLVFLCFGHHDEYDSQSSQSKGLTEEEVKHYRDQLYEALDDVQHNGDNVNVRAMDEEEHSGISISLAMLPSSEPELLGREEELAMLDEAWETPNTKAFSIVAFGGVGKSALVNEWLQRLEQHNYRGAELVFGWSFYSRGPAATRASADHFVAAALEWFGDPDMANSSRTPWDKGERLAELVRKRKTLLILDGLETLQYPTGEQWGELKDPSLKSLLRELAHQNPGLCIITTRLQVEDLKEFVNGSVKQIDLGRLPTQAGVKLLHSLGVQGETNELSLAVDEFDGHALALILLGRYLSVVYKGDVRQRDKISGPPGDRKYGGHATRIMQSYERWLNGKLELDILSVMGLFDGPADTRAIEFLKEGSPIGGLTSRLCGLSEEDWQYALTTLRDLRLLTAEKSNQQNTIDCHPLVREYFGKKLKKVNPRAWQRAHGKLYDYYKSHAEERPDTIEEMIPLYTAVNHGCQAGRYNEALKIYWDRILRRTEYFSTRKLGAFGASLSALSGFFTVPWDRPVDGLAEADMVFVLFDAAYCLWALGRPEDAAPLMRASLDTCLAQKEGYPERSVNIACDLAELYLTVGDLLHALDAAKKSVELADIIDNVRAKSRSRAILASVLHQKGCLSEAEKTFQQSEEILGSVESDFLLYYSISGFHFSELLLDQGDYGKVQTQASRMLSHSEQHGSLLDIALSYLSLGRACLVEAQQAKETDLSQTSLYIDKALIGLEKAGVQHHVPRGFITRAELHSIRGEFVNAQKDLGKAIDIARRGQMYLHEADCYLEYTKMYLAMGKENKAQESLASAKSIIQELGYHRRNKIVQKLGEQISLTPAVSIKHNMEESKKRIARYKQGERKLEISRGVRTSSSKPVTGGHGGCGSGGAGDY